MRRACHQRLVLPALCLGILFGAETTSSEEVDEAQRWVPSLAFSFDAMGQPSAGAVESGNITGPPISDGGCEVRPGQKERGLCREPVPSDFALTPNNRGSDTTTAVLVGLSLELATPELLPLLGRPRLFAHGDGSLVFASERKLAGTGDPGALGPPTPLRGGGSENFSEDTISGQGNRSLSELQTPVLSAGGGVAFSLDFGGRRIRVKPSFEYLRQEIEFTGLVRRAIQLRGSNQSRPNGIEDFRLVSFSARKTRIQHALGAGLEIEADTQRLGPLLLSVFANARYYRVQGDLDLTLKSDRNEIGESHPGEAVTWRFEPEDRIWRGGVGLRLRYVRE